MKFKKYLVCLTAFLTALTTAPAAVYTDTALVNAADQSDQGTKDGYDWDLWNQNGSGNVLMDVGDNGTFSCSWSEIENCLFRSGKKLGGTKTWQDYGEIQINYEVDYTSDGNSYLTVQGSTQDPFIEYYIVEAWGNWRPPGSVNAKANITADGKDYDIYTTTRTIPSIEGTKTNEQYWSVQKTTAVNQRRILEGTITVSDHFAAWEKSGMKMGKMSEVVFSVEGYRSSGEVQVKKNTLKFNGVTPDYLITDTQPQQPPAVEGTEPAADQFKQGIIDGYSWELWNREYIGEASMQAGDNGTFSCSWSDVENCVFSSGRKLGSTKSWQDYSWLKVRYEADYTPKGDSYMYVHGWSQEPLVEYFVVEAWGDRRPPGSNNVRAEITVDGKDYDVYSVKRTMQPCIEGTKTFEQYWSVQKTNPAVVNQKKTISGTVSLTEHFREWEKAGLKMGKMYEVALNVEGYRSSGEAQIRKNFIISGYIPHPDYPITDTEPQQPPAVEGTEPSGSGSGVTDDFEGSGTSWTGRGDGVSIKMATSFKNAGSKSLCVTGRTASWHGFQCSSPELRAGGTYDISMDVGYQDPNYESVEFIAGVQYDSAGVTSYDEIAYAGCCTGKWTTLGGKFSIPDDAENIMLYVHTENIETPVTDYLIDFFIDNVKLTNVSEAAPTDAPNSPGTQPPTPATTTTPAVTTVPAATTTVLTTTTAATADSAATPPATQIKTIYGDADQDGKVDLSDLTKLSQYLLRDITFTPEQIACTDVTADGNVNISDLALLKQFVMNDSVILGKK